MQIQTFKFLTEQRCEYYCGIAANDADSVEEIIISKIDGINGSPEKDLSTHNPKRKTLKAGSSRWLDALAPEI